MVNKRRRITLWVTLIFGIVLLIKITFRHFYPNVTFVNGELVICNKIMDYFLFSAFIMGILLFFKTGKTMLTISATFLFCIFFINSCAAIYPIDTTTQPKDSKVLQTRKNGDQLIMRNYKNAKTNRTIYDTVLVHDYGIFREIIEIKK